VIIDSGGQPTEQSQSSPNQPTHVASLRPLDLNIDGGNGISSGVGDLFHGAGMIGVAALNGGDGVSDWGRSMFAGSGVLFIGTGGSYCSIDEYWR